MYDAYLDKKQLNTIINQWYSFIKIILNNLAYGTICHFIFIITYMTNTQKKII